MSRVVITGYGMLTPLGVNPESTWNSLSQSKSGIRKISDPLFNDIRSKIGGRIWDYKSDDHFTKKEQRRYDPFIEYALVATRQAMKMAGLNNHDETINLDRAGVCIGSGIGGLETIQNESHKVNSNNASKLSPFWIPASLVNMSSGFVSLESGFRGPNFSLVSACATGAHSIISASQIIESDGADIMICGGSEHATVAMGSGGFSAMRALSPNNDNPEHASRPWDKDRDGFVIADGAGILILEGYDHAKRRGATILGELSGYGMNADAYHMTQPSADGSGAARCITNALRKAKISPEDIAYINAHATSTPIGDQIEPLAIRRAFGDHADKLMVSSTKSMHGHTLGAAGAIEAIITLMSLDQQSVPPTINCYEPSPGCDLDFVPHEMRAHKMRHAISNSFGFGGTNASLVLSTGDD